ncbi:MAG: DNA polymerase Y family protein [Rhodospirillales bacterium]|nr:DNA polymerase Y family protein [Rhodospirillales bacterium]
MRRVVSVFLPHWATDRLRKRGELPAPPPRPLAGTAPAPRDGLPEPAGTESRIDPDGAPPLVTVAHDGRRRVLAAVDAAAAALGLRVGQVLSQAQALVPDLAIHPTDPAGDAAALQRLAGWCLRYAPLTATDLPDGVWLDVTGCAHLLGGEDALLRDLVCRLAAQGFAARAAVADTPGAAHAMARFGPAVTTVVAPADQAAALADLPVEALRLPPETLDGLNLMGFERIGAFAAAPRAPLVRRFGPALARRLDQAMGTAFEPILPELPPSLVQARRGFVEPLLTAEAFSAVIAALMAEVCATLEQAGQGARRLDLLFERVDGTIATLRIGTARPSRDARHLGRMFDERLEGVDPGLGVEAMRLVVSAADRLAPVQAAARLRADEAPPADVAALVDRIGNRLGAARIYRTAPVESDVPERSVRKVPPLEPPLRRGWPEAWPRPVRLLDPPQPVEAMALLPDHPPVAFTWRRIRHRVRHADGPERIAGEWWKRDGEMRSVRDYFRVEDLEGRRFWLFRRGDGVRVESGDLRWFLHGVGGG